MYAHNILAGACVMISLALAACTNGDDVSVDPPKLNPRPSQHVKLNVIAAPSLNVRVGASYRIGFWLGLLGGGGEYCGADVHAPAGGVSHPRPGTTVPIDLKWDGRGYEGEFYIDHFLPGRCHWRFFSLDTLSPVNGSVSLYSEYTTKYNFDTSHSHGAYDQSAISTMQVRSS